jgi:hypothetical protein
MWEKTGQTRAPLSTVLEFFNDPRNRAKVQPDLVKEVKVLAAEGDSVTWEQLSSRAGIGIRSVVRQTLDRGTNTFEVWVLKGPGKGSVLTRSLRAIPTGTEVRCAFSLQGGVLGVLLKGRARRTFEDTVDQDVRALDALA